MFLSCVFINLIFVFLTSGQDCNSGMQKRIHFRTDMEHNICRPVNNSDVSLGYQFCKNITFILYIIYNVRCNNTRNYMCHYFQELILLPHKYHQQKSISMYMCLYKIMSNALMHIVLKSFVSFDKFSYHITGNFCGNLISAVYSEPQKIKSQNIM